MLLTLVRHLCPTKRSFGEQFFGSRFGDSIKNLPSDDRKAVIAEAQKALTNYDVAASQKRIRDQVEAGKLTDDEAGRLLEISDFVAQRHGSWETSMSKDFGDDMVSGDALQKLVSPVSMFEPPESSKKYGKTAKPDSPPNDPASYADGVGPLAANMSLFQ